MALIEPLNERHGIPSVAGFLADLAAIHEYTDRRTQTDKLRFRGIADASHSPQLVPSAGRKLTDYFFSEISDPFNEEQERQLLHRFRRRIVEKTGRIVSPLEAMFLGRHHGLPTRLLDWTANPLFALFFACCEKGTPVIADKSEKGKSPADGKVWAIRRRENAREWNVFDLARIETEQELLFGQRRPGDPPRGNCIKILHPFYNSERIVAQDGIFTFHSPANLGLEVAADGTTDFPDAALDIDELYCWNVSKEDKTRLLKELTWSGVTRRSVYPDLDGIARSLAEGEALFPGARKN